MKRSEINNHIVTTASRLFYEQGYNSTGINEIIAEAGVAKATLYNHFKSKDDICIAFLQHKNNAFIASLSSYCDLKKEGDARILAIFDFLLDFYNGDSFNGCWCINTMAEIPKTKQTIKLEIQQQKQGLIQFITNSIQKNKPALTEEQSNVLAKQLYLLYEGAVAESYLQEQSWPITEAKKMGNKILN